MRILVADDTPAVRSAIRRLIHEEQDMQIVAEATNLGELIHRTRAVQPDLILLDWELSGLPGSTKAVPQSNLIALKSAKRRNVILASLRQCASHPSIIVLSGHPDAEQTSLVAGADAFVNKTEPPDRLILAIRALAFPE